MIDPFRYYGLWGLLKDPFNGLHFYVFIDSVLTASFSKVTIPKSTIKVTEYREGSDIDENCQISGRSSTETLVLEKGLSYDTILSGWYDDIRKDGCREHRKDIAIGVYPQPNSLLTMLLGPTWHITNAWPSEFEVGELNADNDDVIIQTMTIVHEGCERIK